jgi:hypothetical protein
MEITQAKAIIRSLADGRDPATGEHFPPNEPQASHLNIQLLATSSASSPAAPADTPDAEHPGSEGPRPCGPDSPAARHGRHRCADTAPILAAAPPRV